MAQAPTPNLDGLPTGVARLPFTEDTKTVPNRQDSPTVWDGPNKPTGASQWLRGRKWPHRGRLLLGLEIFWMFPSITCRSFTRPFAYRRRAQ